MKFKSFTFVNLILRRNTQIIKDIVKLRYFGTSGALKNAFRMVGRLVPEVEHDLETEKYKHRKHPGVRRSICEPLPKKLIEACNIVLADCSQKALAEDIKKLTNYLYSRKPPIETTELQQKVAKAMEDLNFSPEDLEGEDALAVKKLSKLQKKVLPETNRWAPIDYKHHVCILYLIIRLAPNYCALHKVFTEIMLKVPDFKPKTFFDFGSGVGSGIWAAHTFWGESLKEYFCVDSSDDMNLLCQLLLKGGCNDAPMLFKDVYFRQFLPASSERKYDLVISAFSMLDQPSFRDRLRIIDILWQKTNDILVFVESGGSPGFSAVCEARDYILKLENDTENPGTAGAHIIAPCPHELQCPKLLARYPCNAPTKYHPIFPIKSQTSIKTDLFSFVVLRKGPKPEGLSNWPRLIQPVLKKSKYALCRACCSDGKLHDIVFTKGKNDMNTFRCARVSTHGDLLPMTITESQDQTTVMYDSSSSSSDDDSDEDE